MIESFIPPNVIIQKRAKKKYSNKKIYYLLKRIWGNEPFILNCVKWYCWCYFFFLRVFCFTKICLYSFHWIKYKSWDFFKVDYYMGLCKLLSKWINLTIAKLNIEIHCCFCSLCYCFQFVDSIPSFFSWNLCLMDIEFIQFIIFINNVTWIYLIEMRDN